MRKTYFFSDVHLGVGSKDDDRKKEKSLIALLDRVAEDGEHLFIVGDLFDFWFEYRTVVPKGYVRLFAKLADLSESGVSLTYLAGNHDFWLRDYFEQEMGMKIVRDPVERTIHGKRFYLHHGDGLLRNDTGYRILKSVLRNKVNIALFSLVHPDLAAAIARWSSHKSRQYTSKRKYEGDDMATFAEQKINEGYDFVVMGHNHVPCKRNIGQGVYVNLGDWISERTYAVFDGQSLDLKQWEPQHD
ncbi:MAG TPA: UDP-2,3-diacylglucosamine diphosphatase [Bacteroidota bacterium]|nr:UDP-2,3-diacylglucosamine diphosphatase [Bacteroidota bacterium]